MLVLGNTSPSNAAVDDFVLTRTFIFLLSFINLYLWWFSGLYIRSTRKELPKCFFGIKIFWRWCLLTDTWIHTHRSRGTKCISIRTIIQALRLFHLLQTLIHPSLWSSIILGLTLTILVILFRATPISARVTSLVIIVMDLVFILHHHSSIVVAIILHILMLSLYIMPLHRII